MKKNIRLISALTCIFVMQGFVGCSKSNESEKSSKVATQTEITNYISDNFDKYKSKIKEETGFDGRITNEKIDENEAKCIEFDIDNITKVEFQVDNTTTVVIKQLEQLNEPNESNPKKELDVALAGMEDDSSVIVTVKSASGSISCGYKANNLDNPGSSAKQRSESSDIQIKQVASTEELNELTSKTHSIYNAFKKIYEENNKK